MLDDGTEAVKNTNPNREVKGRYAKEGTGDQTGGLKDETGSPKDETDGSKDQTEKVRIGERFERSVGQAVKDRADKQARDFGYKDRHDMINQAATVSDEKIAEIAKGGGGRCKPHEAIAFIQRGGNIKDQAGNECKFTESLIGHYVYGQRRKDNMPKIEALADLPMAVRAIRQDADPKVERKFGAMTSLGNSPAGTQKRYRIPVGRKNIHVYAYVDS